jgi:hypothetical protein
MIHLGVNERYIPWKEVTELKLKSFGAYLTIGPVHCQLRSDNVHSAAPSVD